MVWLSVLFFVLFNVRAEAQDDPLKDYKPIADMAWCQDVQLPCILAIPKTADLHFVIFGKDGKLVAITRIHDNGKEEVVWGTLTLPKKLKPNEKEL